MLMCQSFPLAGNSDPLSNPSFSLADNAVDWADNSNHLKSLSFPHRGIWKSGNSKPELEAENSGGQKKELVSVSKNEINKRLPLGY